MVDGIAHFSFYIIWYYKKVSNHDGKNGSFQPLGNSFSWTSVSTTMYKTMSLGKLGYLLGENVPKNRSRKVNRSRRLQFTATIYRPLPLQNEFSETVIRASTLLYSWFGNKVKAMSVIRQCKKYNSSKQEEKILVRIHFYIFFSLVLNIRLLRGIKCKLHFVSFVLIFRPSFYCDS